MGKRDGEQRGERERERERVCERERENEEEKEREIYTYTTFKASVGLHTHCTIQNYHLPTRSRLLNAA